MRKGTPHTKVIHARSLRSNVRSGERSGRNAATSQKTVEVRNAIGAAPATPITQYRITGVRCAMPRIRSTISMRIGINATQNQLKRIML